MRLTHPFTRLRIVYLGAFLLTLLCVLLFGSLTSNAQPKAISDSLPVEITQGWQYRWGDSPLNDAGVPIWTEDRDSNTEWIPLKVPGQLPKKRGYQSAWLRVQLPNQQWKYPSLDLRNIPFVTDVYLAGSKIDTLEKSDLSSNAFEANLPLLRLKPNYQNQTLYFRIYAEGTEDIGVLDSVTIGSSPDVLKKIVKQETTTFVLGFFFTCIGLFPLLTLIGLQEKKVAFCFGILALSIGINALIQSEILFLIFPNQFFWKSLSSISFYLIPVGFGAFFEQVFGAGHKSMIRRIWQAHLIYALVSFIVSFNPFIPKIYTRYPFYALSVFSMVVIMTMTVKLVRKGNLDAKLFATGFSIFCLIAIHDILIDLKVITGEFGNYYWGMFIFILFMGMILQRRFVEARKRLQAYSKELEAKNAALEEMDQLKDEFLANTSHELRTPLNGIIGIAESMVDGATGELSSVQIFNLSMVVSSAKRLNQLVNDILDFAKLKHKNIQLKKSSVGMREIADVVLALSQPLIGHKNLQLRNLIQPDIPPVYADENRLQQILHNLVGNAIKFTDSGLIEVSAEVVNQKLAITVSDTGIGIPEDKLQLIFESFEQVDGSAARTYGGTGLGLAVTKQLVELHSGEVWVRSKLNVGSQFTFTLPLATNEPVTNSSVATKSAIAPLHALSDFRENRVTFEASSETQKAIVSPSKIVEIPPEFVPEPVGDGDFKVLIVDDEPINLQVLVNNLSLQHYAIVQASNGIEALNLMENGFTPDLILLDVMMPKMTGYEVCQKIREKFPANELPVVLLTAKNQVTDLVEGLDAGANDYLSKPISKNELLARIKTHIHLAKLNVAYARFVPRAFLRYLEKESILDVRLGDQVQREMSILFSDIRSFTSLSEKMTPKENFDFINEYLSQVGPLIRDRNGFIDKYIGDAVMALFPEKPEDAILAAIDMQQKVSQYNLMRQEQSQPPIAIGIGLHTGTLMLGTVGESQRMDTTVISDAVNLASRLEGLTKLYGAGIVASMQTISQVADESQYHYRFLGQVRVKGKQAPVSIFEIYDGDPIEIQALKTQTRIIFEQAVHLYDQQELSAADQLLEQVLTVNSSDKAAQYYRKRCAELQAAGRVVSWDGIETLEEKL